MIVLLIALRQLRAGRPLLLCCLFGGLAASLFEPFVDVLGMVYLTEHGSIHTFTLLGRTMPLVVPVIIPPVHRRLRLPDRAGTATGRHPPPVPRPVGGLRADEFRVGGARSADYVYTYYGKQPFNFWGHPMWWGAANAFTAIAGGAAVFGFTKLFPAGGWATVGVIPLIFIAEGLSNAGTGFPMYAMLHDNRGWGWEYPAALLTIGLIVYCVWLIGTVAQRLAPAQVFRVAPAVGRRVEQFA